MKGARLETTGVRTRTRTRVQVVWSPRATRRRHPDLGRRVTYFGRVAGDVVCYVEQFPDTGYPEWNAIIALGVPMIIDRRRSRRVAMRACEQQLRRVLSAEKPSAVSKITGSSSLVQAVGRARPNPERCES